MKTQTLFSYLFAILLFCSFNLQAQEIIKTSAEHKLSSKAAAPGALIDFIIEKENNEISMKYLIKDNKKKIEFETYTYDMGSLSQKGIELTEIEKEKAKKKFRHYKDKDAEPTRFIRVKNNISRQMVLERGYVLVTTYSGAPGVASSEFITEKKEKFKDEENRKQTMVAFRTDADEVQFTFTTWSEAWAPKTGFLATGNALVFATVNPKKFNSGEYSPGTRFNAMLISQKDFSVLSEHQIDFKYPYYPFTGVETADGGMAFVLIPMNKGSLAGYSIHAADDVVQPNLNEYILLTIDAEGNETGRFPFEVKQQNANLKINVNRDGDYLIYGFADELVVGPEDKKPNFTPGYLDNFQISLIEAGIRIGSPVAYEAIKISKTGETIFSTSTPLKNTLENVSFNSNEKLKQASADKWEKYYKDGAIESPMFEVGDQLFVQLTTADKNYLLIQFNELGNFVKGYLTTKSGDRLANSEVAQGPNSTVYWLNYEHPEAKAHETWMKIVQINPDKKEVLASEIPGDKKYFMQGDVSFVSAEGLNETIIYLKAGKNIYLGKLPMK